MPSKEGLIIPGDRNFRFGAAEVNKLHDYDDVDVGPTAHHHTLGSGPNQAASGSHKHFNRAYIYKSAADGIAAGTWTRMGNTNIFESVLDDDFFVHDAVNGEIEVKKAGWYLAIGYLSLNSGGAQQAYVRIRWQDISSSRHNHLYSGSGHYELGITDSKFLSVGKAVALDAFMTGGGSFMNTVTVDEDLRSKLQVIRLG